MKYELRENQGIPVPLLALMAVATGLSVANCYYNQPLLGSMAKDFAVSDFSASMVATLTQIGYVAGLVFVIPLGDLVSRKRLILTNYIVSSCALLAIALAPNIYWVWGASLLAGASSVMPQFFIPLVSYNSAPDQMKKEVKDTIITELGQKIQEFPHFYLVDVTGLDAEKTSNLRPSSVMIVSLTSFFILQNF